MLPRPQHFKTINEWAQRFVEHMERANQVRWLAERFESGDNLAFTYNPVKNTITITGTLSGTDLTYTPATRVLASSTGTDVTLPLVSSTDAGLAPASGGGTSNFLRADGSWTAPPSGATNLGYTASTRILTSDTGTDVTLPLFTDTDPGLTPASGGGTSNFLRADGTWAAPGGGGGGSVAVEDEGVSLTAAVATIDFVGSGVEATVSGSDVTVTIPSTGRACVTPVLADFTWVNQGSAAATQYSYGVGVTQPGLTSDSLACLVKTAPATPYTIVARFSFMARTTTFTGFGLLWRESGTGELSVLTFNYGSTTSQVSIVGVNNWNSPTSFNAANSAFNASNHVYWYRIRDDGTTRYADVSANGDDWINFFSVARTTFLTPNQVGIMINNYQTTTTRVGASLNWLSWEEG